MDMTTNDPKKPDILELARRSRHVKILEKLQRGIPPTQAELKELVKYEGGSELGPGILENQEQVAKVFSVSLRTVSYWAREGMPVRGDGKYDIKQIQGWRFKRSEQKPNAKKAYENWDAKYREYKARLEEIKLKTAIGELVSRREVEAGLVQISIVIKRALLSLPRAVSPRLVGLETREIESIIRERVEEIINLFAKDEIFGESNSRNIKGREKAKNLDG